MEVRQRFIDIDLVSRVSKMNGIIEGLLTNPRASAKGRDEI